MIDTLIKEVADEIEKKVTSGVQKDIDMKMSQIDAKLAEATTGADLRIKIGKKTTTLKGPKHQTLTQLIKVSAQRLPVLLVGMAGTGKTHAAEQVAQALDLDFYAMSVGAQTSKSDLMGFIHAGGSYIPTMFRKAFEFGGVFLMDEIDAGNSNVLVQLNAALSNGYCAFPDRMVLKHEDFTFIASANTYGQGASRQYVGRNQLDAATLDRFVVLDWDIDKKLELSFARDDLSKKWYEVVVKVRDYIDSEGIRALVTPRATIKGAVLLEAGLSFKDVLSSTILGGIAVDKQKLITKIAKEAWEPTEPVAVKLKGAPEGFEAGMQVRVLDGRKIESIIGWASPMDDFIGTVQTIKEKTVAGNYKLLDDQAGWAFHETWLEKV